MDLELYLSFSRVITAIFVSKKFHTQISNNARCKRNVQACAFQLVAHFWIWGGCIVRFVTAGLASTIATIGVPVAIVYNHFYHCHNRHRNIWVTLICNITHLPGMFRSPCLLCVYKFELFAMEPHCTRCTFSTRIIYMLFVINFGKSSCLLL